MRNQFKFLTLNDIHLYEKTPTSRKDNYLESTLEKLNFCAEMTQKEKLDATLIAGDIFHVPYPNKVPHFLVKETAGVFRKFHGKIIVIGGNHDLLYHNIKYLHRQPLGVLVEMGLMHLLDNAPVIFESGNLKIKIVGKSYNHDNPLDGFSLDSSEDDEIVIQLAHMNCNPEGFLSYGERCFSYAEMSKFNFDILLLGHLHHNYGIQKYENKYFINLGSLTRGSLSEDNIERDITVSRIDIGSKVDINIREVSIPTKRGVDIFDIDKHEKIQQENKMFDDFVTMLRSSNSKTLNLLNVDKNECLDKLNVSSELRELCLHYLEKGSS